MTNEGPKNAAPSATTIDSGPVGELLAALAQALQAKSFVKLTLSKPLRRSVATDSIPTQAYIRLVEIKHAPHISILLRHPHRDITENHRVDTAADVISTLLRSTFHNAHLFSTQGDIELRTNNKGEARLYHGRATFSAAAPPDHDRVRRYVLDPSKAPYLQELGIVSAEGKVKSDKADKYKQLQHIIKLLEDFVGKSELREKQHLRVVDMGSGKGYLTFALYDYCNNELGIPTTVLGIDRNAELTGVCNNVASKLGYRNLQFECSTVEEIELGEADIVIALHACDTATDVALFKGVAAGAAIIMAVPCCQKELRPQLKVPIDERPLLKHDTYKDRYSQMLTDALRGLLLESQGYRTRVMEFISDAHTHRNVMIVGIHAKDFAGRDTKRADAATLQRRYGVTQQTLERLLIEAGRIAAAPS